LDKFAIKAGDKAKGFLDLRQRVLNYRTNLVQLVGDQQEEVKQKIKDIINQIRDLEKTLAEYVNFLDVNRMLICSFLTRSEGFVRDIRV
jgi:hypothetical protein